MDHIVDDNAFTHLRSCKHKCSVAKRVTTTGRTKALESVSFDDTGTSSGNIFNECTSSFSTDSGSDESPIDMPILTKSNRGSLQANKPLNLKNILDYTRMPTPDITRSLASYYLYINFKYKPRG